MHPHFLPPTPPCPTGKSLRVPPLGAIFGTDSEPLSPTRSAGGDPSAQPVALTRSSDGGATSSSGQGVEGVDGVAESVSTGGSGLGGILRMGRGQSRSGGRSTSMPGTPPSLSFSSVVSASDHCGRKASPAEAEVCEEPSIPS